MVFSEFGTGVIIIILWIIQSVFLVLVASVWPVLSDISANLNSRTWKKLHFHCIFLYCYIAIVNSSNLIYTLIEITHYLHKRIEKFCLQILETTQYLLIYNKLSRSFFKCIYGILKSSSSFLNVLFLKKCWEFLLYLFVRFHVVLTSILSLLLGLFDSLCARNNLKRFVKNDWKFIRSSLISE